MRVDHAQKLDTGSNLSLALKQGPCFTTMLSCHSNLNFYKITLNGKIYGEKNIDLSVAPTKNEIAINQTNL